MKKVSKMVRISFGGDNMIDFNEELSKYKPILVIDEVETSIQTDEIKDMMDLLQYITDQVSGRRRKG